MSKRAGDAGSSSIESRSGRQNLADRGSRWTLLALVVAVPITVAPGLTHDPFNVPKFGIFVIGLSIALALYGFARGLGSDADIPRAAWVVPIAVLGPLMISWFFSPYRIWALFGQYSRLQGLLPYAAFAIFSILVVATFRGRERQLAWALAVVGGLVGVGLLLGMGGILVSNAATQAGTLGNSNYVGGFLAITLPLSLHLWLTQRGRSYAAMTLTALTITGLILSYSQGGQAAAVAGAALVVGSQLGNRWARPMSLAIAALVAVGVVVIVALNFVRPVGGYTAMTRSQMWRTALAMGADSPLVGSGPNTYAIEGPRYRSLEDSVRLRGFVGAYVPIGIGYQTSDDPHSVPLSFFANAGALGLIGLLGGWGWAIWRGLSHWGRGVGTAFFAATVGYLLQALVSIDEVTLRFGFWSAVGGLVATTLPRGDHPSPAPSPPSRPRAAIAGFVALLIALGGTWYGVGFIRADERARQGARLFGEGDAQGGTAALRASLSFRDEALYRELLAGKLGLAALERSRRGAAFIQEMRDVNTYLADLPDVGAIHAYARIMSYWGHYDASAFDVALELFRRAAQLDPANPLIIVETAEVLIDLGRPQDALSLLEPLSLSLQDRVPEYWAALAVAKSLTGDVTGARGALEEGAAVDASDCRVMLADILLTVQMRGSLPTGPAVLNFRINCDPGLYNMLLRRLPTSVSLRLRRG